MPGRLQSLGESADGSTSSPPTDSPGLSFDKLRTNGQGFSATLLSSGGLSCSWKRCLLQGYHPRPFGKLRTGRTLPLIRRE